jgi:hypothetical protein
MAKSDIDLRRKALFDTCLDLVAQQWSALGTVSKREANRLLLTAPNHSEVLVDLSSVKQGYGYQPGEFGTNTAVIVSKGPLLDVMKQLRLMDAEELADGRLYQTGSLDYLEADESYALRLPDDIAVLAERIARDLARFARPKVAKVHAAGPDLVPLVLDRPDDFEKPFATVAAVLLLNQRPNELQAFWDQTAGSESIWDRPTAARFAALMKKATAKRPE